MIGNWAENRPIDGAENWPIEKGRKSPDCGCESLCHQLYGFGCKAWAMIRNLKLKWKGILFKYNMYFHYGMALIAQIFSSKLCFWYKSAVKDIIFLDICLCNSIIILLRYLLKVVPLSSQRNWHVFFS